MDNQTVSVHIWPFAGQQHDPSQLCGRANERLDGNQWCDPCGEECSLSSRWAEITQRSPSQSNMKLFRSNKGVGMHVVNSCFQSSSIQSAALSVLKITLMIHRQVFWVFFFCHIRWCICNMSEIRSWNDVGCSYAWHPASRTIDWATEDRWVVYLIGFGCMEDGPRPSRCLAGVTLYKGGKQPLHQIHCSCALTCTVLLQENRVWLKCGTHDVILMTLADLPVGRNDLLVLLKKLIRFIHIKVEKKSIRFSKIAVVAQKVLHLSLFCAHSFSLSLDISMSRSRSSFSVSVLAVPVNDMSAWRKTIINCVLLSREDHHNTWRRHR